MVTDGKAGNETPALSLAEALAAARAPAMTEISVKRIALKRAAAALPAPVWPLLAARKAGVAGWPFSALADRGADLAQPWPDLIISAGRRSAPIAAEMRRRAKGALKAVQILDPKMSPARFDLVIVPEHDGLSGEGVLSLPAALGRNAPPDALPDARLDALPRPLLGVLLGGPSRPAKVTQADYLSLADRVAQARASGFGVAVLRSRRTPEWAPDLFRGAGGDGLFVWDGAEPNPYLALIRSADVFFVTADSVNMVSEAAATGKPVYSAPVAHLAQKLVRFHEAMERAGHVRPISRFDAAENPTAPDAWRPERLDTLSQAVSAVLPLLRGAVA